MLKCVLLALTFIAAWPRLEWARRTRPRPAMAVATTAAMVDMAINPTIRRTTVATAMEGMDMDTDPDFRILAATVIRTTDTMVAVTMATMAIAITVTIMAAYTSRLASSVQPAKRAVYESGGSTARNAGCRFAFCRHGVR